MKEHTASTSHNVGRQWTPKSEREEHLDSYIEAVQRDVLRAYNARKPGAQNLSKEEREALKALGDRTDIVIKPADKGGGIVILSKPDYIKEGHRQLNNEFFYQKLDADRTVEHQEIITTALNNLVEIGEIEPRLCEAL